MKTEQVLLWNYTLSGSTTGTRIQDHDVNNVKLTQYLEYNPCGIKSSYDAAQYHCDFELCGSNPCNLTQIV